MKNYKVFSLLGLTILLTACPKPAEKAPFEISEPNFAAMGQEVTMNEYREGMLSSLGELDIYTSGDHIFTNKRVHTVRSSDSTFDLMQNGKKANKHLLTKNITDNALDEETKVGSISQDNRSYQTGYEKDNGEKHETSNYYIQKVRIANEDYFANVFPDKHLIKTTNYGVIDETNTEEKHFSNATFMLVVPAIDYFETREFLQQLSTLSEAELANYKFYKNNNTYTSVYTYSITGVTDPMKTTNTSTATTEKIQFTFTYYGFDYLASFNQDAKLKYLKDNGDSIKKGDYTNTKHFGYIECKYEDSPTNLNLEPVDYTDFDTEVDIEY